MTDEEKNSVKATEKKEVEVKVDDGPPAAEQGKKPDAKNQGRKPFKRRDKKKDKSDDGLFESVLKINRVAKVVKGGKNFSFSALVVAGDCKGQVGIGFGKSNELSEAITKGSAKAKKSFVRVKMSGDTIPHEIIGRFKSSKVILKPAGAGTGVIAGGPVRAVCDAVGIKDILTKSLGSRNAINVVRATVDGFLRLRLNRRG